MNMNKFLIPLVISLAIIALNMLIPGVGFGILCAVAGSYLADRWFPTA